MRIWQANIGKRILAHVPVRGGQVVEEGDFELDGVTFPAAEVKLEFMDPGAEGDGMFPTGSVVDFLEIRRIGTIEATLINAGNPTIFVAAASLGLKGTEMQDDVNGNAALLARVEAIRAHGAVAMEPGEERRRGGGSAATRRSSRSSRRPRATPPPSGRQVGAESIDLLARIFSMGKLHHAMTGTGGVAIAVAAAIPGTLVHRIARAGAPTGASASAIPRAR